MKQIRNSLLKLLILASLFVLFIGVTPIIYAADIVDSGYCGAEDEDKNLSWTLDSDGLLTISGKGRMKNMYPAPPWADKKIWTVKIENGVTSIGDWAFRDCSSLESITIPNGVTSIGDLAFNGCINLKSITIPESVTSIGYSTFEECNGLTAVTIPDSVTSIDDWAFRNCSNLESVTIPNGVTKIGDGAFIDCIRLERITIPESVTSIGNSMFEGCVGLVTVTIPDSVTSIGDVAFGGCSSLTNITIPSDVTNINHGTFSGCSSLTSIIIPNGVTSIGNNVFNGCSSLTSIMIPDSVTSIGGRAFEDCSSLTSITIPNGVTSIGEETFCSCSSLTSITIPNSVTSIGEWAFRYCGNLESVVTPSGVTSIGSIGECAFQDCSSLVNITLSNSATSIGSSIGKAAFSGCSSLTNITIPNGVTSIGNNAFGGCSSLTSITIPDSVTSIGDVAFGGCSSLTNITIPSDVTNINHGTFSGCSSLTSIIIPNGVTSIGNNAFNGCSSLMSIMIPDSITSIGGGAFEDCSSLTSITIPNGVTSIGDYTFYYCNKLTNITIPDSVTSIGQNAFTYCYSLTSIEIPSSVTSIGHSAFKDCRSLVSITIPNGVTNVGDYTFYYCYKLKNITIPDSVKSIGEYAFYQCDELTSITIPNGVTSISDYTFYKCDRLMSISIPSSVTNIGKYAFAHCSRLTSITIPKCVTSIGYCAFYDCRNMVSIILPNSMTAIESYAFGYCGSLESITIPRNITSIGNYAFKDCSNLESAHFCGNAPDIWPSTFSGCKNTFCIYYMPGTSGWTDSSAYDAAAGTWNGYPLKIWDGKIVPEETKLSVPTGKYCIQVIDESGAPINDATVWWNGSRASTEENGNVFVDLVTVGEPVIRVVKSGYIEWTNKYSNWKKSETRFERVILYPESHGSLKLKSAKLGKCDLLTQTKVLNLRNDGALIGDLNSGHFDLTCAATDSSVVTGYALYQNTKKIAESADGSFTKLDVRDFVEGGGCFVRVAGTNGQTMDTHINLQFAKNSVNEDFKLELKDNHISFDVSDDVPYIGGTTISVDLPLEVPVVVSATTDKMKFGINLKLNPDKSEEEQIDSYIKTIKKAVVAEGVNLSKANAKALKNCAAQHNKAKFFKDFDITVCGYAEADFGSNTASGYMLFIVDWQLVDYEYNTVIIIPIAPPLAVPITVQVGAELSLEAGATVSYKLDARTWNGNVVLNPSVGLTPFAGIGYGRVAGIGVYGNADLNAKINLWGKNSGCQAVDLTGEFGAKGYFGPLEWTKAFAHQTWHLYTANTVSSLSLLNVAPAWNAAPEASDFEVSDLSYLAEESAWAPASPQIYRTSRTAQLKASYQMLLQNTYRNAQPVMISDGSALYAAFVRADANTGARYVALSKFDGTNWSEPVRIDTSAILDNAPQLCTDGQTLWLAYARTTQEPDDSLVSYAQHQNIVVGTVNKDTLAFAEQKIYQSDEYMHLPTLSCVNGTPVLAWAESAVTDMDSVIVPKNSTVYLAKYQNGAWTQVEQTAASASVIDSICIGARNGAPTVAYTADGKLYCGGSILSESVTGRAVYGRLPGTAADSFLWNANGALHNEAGDTVPTEDMGRDFVIVGSSIYYNQSNGASANLAALHYDAANDHWSAPILLIGDERYLENLNAAELNGKTYALGLHTTVTISEDDVNDAKDLVWTQILPISDLKLSDVSFDADALVPGEMIPVTLTVTNSGDHTVSSLTLVADGAGTAQDCQLLPGESAEFTVNIICPSEKQTVTFEVQEPRQGDYTPEDNTSSCTVGSADAEIELALVQIGSRKLVQAAVVNRGLEAASGSVLFTDSDGQILAERTFQNLRYGDAVIAEYEPDSFADLYGKDVNATVVLQQDERNTLNNSDSVPVLFLASTQITAAYQSGNALKAEVCCAEPAKAVCAFYDQYGKMLDVQMQSLQTEKVNTLSFDIKDARTKIAKIFVLDTGSASPVCAAWNVTVE